MALETMIILPVWIIVVFLYIELLLVLGSTMLVRSDLDRAAIQASSLGCVTQGIVDEIQNVKGFGISGHLTLDEAVYLPGAPGPGVLTNYYSLPQSGNALNTTGWLSAEGTQPNCVAQGDYIYLQVSYQESGFLGSLFGSGTYHQDALVVSQTLL